LGNTIFQVICNEPYLPLTVHTVYSASHIKW